MRKWYSLIDKVYALENLHQAFKHVKSNKGDPGIDEETVEDFGWLFCMTQSAAPFWDALTAYQAKGVIPL